MQKKIYIPVFIIILIIIFLNNCKDISIDFSESEKRGNLIVDALNKYYKDKAEYPFSLDSLTPNYLREIPSVANKRFFPLVKRKFRYVLWDYIPYNGCFIISYDCKKDGKNYHYDSRTNKTEWSGISTIYPDRADISIDHMDIEKIVNGIKSYYNDSLKYPTEIMQLTPIYLDSIPFDLNAQYRPILDNPQANSVLFEYTFHQPSDAFRGVYRVYFEVTFGQYINYNGTNWYYDD